MKAKLKRLHSPDIKDLENYLPEDHQNFGFLLQAMIGPECLEGEESFDIEVCTPKWLEEKYNIDDVVIGRHHIIVQEYNYKRIVNTINKYISNCDGANWDEVALKVSRLGRWEFEDYTEK